MEGWCFLRAPWGQKFRVTNSEFRGPTQLALGCISEHLPPIPEADLISLLRYVRYLREDIHSHPLGLESQPSGTRAAAVGPAFNFVSEMRLPQTWGRKPGLLAGV